MRNKRNNKGQVFIEAVCGMFILIPIALAGLDCVVLVLSNSANDSLAKSCARAAANAQDSTGAKLAAQQVVSQFPTSPIIEKVELDTSKLSFNPKENVSAETIVTVRLPVVLPGTQSSLAFRARAIEPVVGVTAAPI